MSQSPSQIDDSESYLIRHWRGELPLWQSFWLNGVLLGLAFNLAIWLTQPRYTMMFDIDLDDGAVLLCAVLILLYLPVQVWQLVGISRAATRYQRNGGVVAWATLAQVVVILSFFLLIVRLTVGLY